MSIGSTVFLDVDDSGTLDAGETGIEGITISLYDVSTTFITSDTTNISGTYLLTGLVPGNYYIIIEEPPATATGSSSQTGLEDNQVDNDDNGQQPGGPGAPVISPIITLTANGEPAGETGQGGDQDDANDSNGDMTIDFGFVPVQFGVTVGDRVWEDLDRNGIQDAGEPGVADISVFIFNANTGKPMIDSNGDTITDVTDADGLYLFEALPPGNYYVIFGDLPDGGYQVTDRDAGDDDAKDSDAYPALLQTSTTGPLLDGVQYRNLDMGVFRDATLATIGDYVWYDYDGDGIQGTSTDEYGLTNVSITLYESSGVLIETVSTGASGQYLFENVPPGNYFVQATPPNQFLIPVWSGRGNNTELDSDIDSDTLRTDIFTLTEGGQNLTLDIGFSLAATLSSYFWIDVDKDGLFDTGEAPVVNAEVTLEDENGTEVATVQTDTTGLAQFVVPPGRYRLHFENLAEYNFTMQNATGTINSDVGPDGMSPLITLGPGDDVTSISAGIVLRGPTSLIGVEEPGALVSRIFIPITNQ